MKSISQYILISGLCLILAACESEDKQAGEALREIVAEMIEEERENTRDGILIHISAGPDDPHRVLMPLQMAVMMADDRDVMVYFDIDAVQVVLEGAEDLTYAQFPSSSTQIEALLDKDVPLAVCPGCLQAAGYSKRDVMDGVDIAEKEKFFEFTEGRIVTLDY